ncbi:uncharacterized protein LOC112465013 [Temnothorax curvispinosus]|uniref:Uncharacterized protein LOC112465013 n=1 Tax=Temnothorax curvispinosus TaxID=300111 RepID=A0A6J1R592_9HYME|nr:uncharacterized protein LOC112465013 [Temnothorax curvispinosus]
MLHVLAAIYIGAASMMATGTIFIAYFQHICGMFGIASYRIEQAINILQKDILKSENMVYKEITYAVDIHRKAMELTDFLISNFERSFFFLIVIGVTCASINLFQLASYSDGIEKLVVPILKLTFLYVFLFLANYVAQEATIHNECVFATVYNVQWYTAPLHIQKIILFLLQRGTKPFHINLGGIFVASLESAATWLRVAIPLWDLFIGYEIIPPEKNEIQDRDRSPGGRRIKLTEIPHPDEELHITKPIHESKPIRPRKRVTTHHQ